MREIYLDAAATARYTETDDIVVNTITSAMKRYWMNPSSLYATDVREEIDKCRANIARFIGANPSELYFVSGASEANNWAIRGWIDWVNYNLNKTANVITTCIEHKSIIEATKNPCLNAIIAYCNVDNYGVIDLNSLVEELEDCMIMNEPILVVLGMVNNEIGTCQQIKVISDIVHRFNGILYVDATQAIGHIPINVKELGIDMLGTSGHKISPVLKGIGFLYKREDIEIMPLIYGNQEKGLRAGTENTFGIIGLSKAIEYCDVSDRNVEEMINKRDYFINQLITKFGCKLNGHSEYRLPNNISITFPQNITGESLLYTLDLAGIKCSVASACNSKEIKPSYVLKAIGLSDVEAMKTVRFTLPRDITYQDIDIVIDEIEKAIKLINL